MPRNLYATVHGWKDLRRSGYKGVPLDKSEGYYRVVERGSFVFCLPGRDIRCNGNRTAGTIRGIFSKFAGILDGPWAIRRHQRCCSACMQPGRYCHCFPAAIFSPTSPFLTGLPARYTIDALESAWSADLEHYHTSHYRCRYCNGDLRGHTRTLRKVCTHGRSAF